MFKKLIIGNESIKINVEYKNKYKYFLFSKKNTKKDANKLNKKSIPFGLIEIRINNRPIIRGKYFFLKKTIKKVKIIEILINNISVNM